MKIRCNHCEWKGDEDELILSEADETQDTSLNTELCPNCKRGDALMDIESGEFL